MPENQIKHHVTLFMQQDNARDQVRDKLINILVQHSYSATDSSYTIELDAQHVAALDSLIHLLGNIRKAMHPEEQGTY